MNKKTEARHLNNTSKHLKEIMQDLNCSQRELGRCVGISQTTLSFLINKKRPISDAQVHALASLGYNPNWVSGKSEIKFLEKDEPKVKAEPKTPAKPEAKDDKSKPRPSLCPSGIIKAITAVREFGSKKYGDEDNWKQVEADRYWNAMLRHILKCWDDPNAIDEESGLPHIYHVACNLAFIIELKDKELNK